MALDDFFSKFAPVDNPNRAACATPQKPAPDSFDDLLLGERKQPVVGKIVAEEMTDTAFISEQDFVDATQAAPLDQNLFSRPDNLAEQLANRQQRVRSYRSKKLLQFAWGLGIPLSFSLLLTIGCLWMWRSGRMDVYGFRLANALQNSSKIFGLTVDDVAVNGRGYTPLDDIIEAISANNGDAILTLDPAGVKSRLETLPWVKTASVERILPAKLKIDLVERQPIAIWQNNGIHRLIDRDGAEILGASVEPFANKLPIVTGLNAPEHSDDLFRMLKGETELFEQTLAATRVGDRRWDITLIGKIVVKLPDQNAKKAWSLLAEAQRRGRLLDRNIKAIDLRSPDRIIVTSSHELVPNPVNFTPESSTKAPSDAVSANNRLTDA